MPSIEAFMGLEAQKAIYLTVDRTRILSRFQDVNSMNNNNGARLLVDECHDGEQRGAGYAWRLHYSVVGLARRKIPIPESTSGSIIYTSISVSITGLDSTSL